jgi:hypothetical protein
VCPWGEKTVHALRSHMSALSFRTKPSIQDSVEDISDGAFVWASRNIRGQDVVEFVSCGIWPLYASVDFEHVKVDLTPASQLKAPLPRFPLSREDGEDDTRLLARVEQEVRNIMDSYTCTEHKACIASLPNNGRLNCVLEVAGVAYGPFPVPISTEVLKKRKVDEKKGVELSKVSRAHASGGSKWPSVADVLPAKSTKLSKGTVPHAIASAATTRIMPETCGSKYLVGASGSKAGGRRPDYKTMPGAKAAPSAKKCIVPVIGALVVLSSEGYFIPNMGNEGHGTKVREQEG